MDEKVSRETARRPGGALDGRDERRAIRRVYLRSLTALLLLLLAPWLRPSAHDRRERVRVNDNRRAAGATRDGLLTLHLEARLGAWHPDGDSAPGADVPAFAEAGKPTEIPGPLIRVPAGTEVALTVRNAVPNAVLTVRGLHARPLTTPAVDTLQIASGATRPLRFRLDAPGTYYYWGTTMGREFRGRTREDAQLSGALIVDEPGQRAPDRILVIGVWEDTAGGVVLARERERELMVVNGRSWPHTERLSYTVGDTVRWRVLNVSADVHPMHLHGFYYQVIARGDGTGDTSYSEARRDLIVTQRMIPGQTMQMTWIPERAGNWLFHCHIPRHFAPRGPLGLRRPGRTRRVPGGHATANHALDEMNGLVVGVTVVPGKRDLSRPAADEAGRRHLRLLVRENAGGSGAEPYFGFALHEGGTEPPADSGHHPGPPILLTRGQPVSIMVVNRTPEPTAVHWHGIELESYFDGVAGFSGSGTHLAPVIAPGDSFEARFTPPRAGTFIYHTHVDELRQQPAGLAGALIVLEPGAQYDPATDLTVLITTPRDSADEAQTVFINGRRTPAPLDVQVGVPHRLRIINITIGRPSIRVELRRDTTLLSWRALAKDGGELPAVRQLARPARQVISIGETYDFELTPAAAGEYRVEVRRGSGTLLAVMLLRAVLHTEAR